MRGLVNAQRQADLWISGSNDVKGLGEERIFHGNRKRCLEVGMTFSGGIVNIDGDWIVTLMGFHK